MKRFWNSVGAAVVALGLISPLFAADEGWLVDFKAAKEKAAAEGKDLLMEFTGSDWCPPCINFKKTVLDSEVFKTVAPENYILLKLDNPKDKSKQTPEEIEQYKKLSAEYKISGVPTVILADTQGRPFVKMVGYGGTPADEYVKDLVAKRDVRKARDENFAKAEAADGVEKAKLLDAAISGVDTELAMSQFRDKIDEIISLDKDNAGGLKGKYEGLVKTVGIKTALQDIMRSANPTNLDEVIKKLDDLVSEQHPEGEGLQEVLFVKAQILFRTDKEKSKSVLLAAQKAAPESATAKNIDRILKQFFAEESKDDNAANAAGSVKLKAAPIAPAKK